MSQRTKQFYEFGPFRIDVGQRVLLRDGEPVAMPPKAFDTLLALVSQHGRLREKDDLLKTVWPETFVEEGNLGHQIFQVRRVLGEGSDGQRYIETVPKRGYRFAAPVREFQGDEKQRSRAGLGWAAAGLLAAFVVSSLGLNLGGLRDRVFGRGTAPPIESIAVLPLENLSGDPEQEYIADGVTEALINELAKVRALKVISRTSTRRYKGSETPLPEIARTLNVDAVVEGSAVRSGDRVRIIVQLIDGKTDEHLWAESYEREFSAVLVLQSEIAQAIAREIKIAVTPEETTRLASADAVEPEAYEAYLRGRFHWQRFSPPDLQKALEYYDLALEKDPEYAPAYAGIGSVWNARGLWGGFPADEAVPKARAAIAKAIELDSKLALAHYALACSEFYYEWNWAGAEREFLQAIELNPNHVPARLVYSDLLLSLGRFDEALEHVERGLELDPLNSFPQGVFGWNLLCLHRYDDAIAHLRETLKSEPDSSLAHRFIWAALHQKGMSNRALQHAREFFAVQGYDEAAEALSSDATMDGYTATMRLAAEKLAERSGLSYTPAMHIARLYAHAGDNDRALAWLEKARETRFPSMVSLNVDPDWSGLRDEKEFQDLLRKMDLRLH